MKQMFIGSPGQRSLTRKQMNPRSPYTNRQLLNADNRTLKRLGEARSPTQANEFLCKKCDTIVRFAQLRKHKNDTYHNHCFTCDACGKSLEPNRFRTRKDQHFCYNCRPSMIAKLTSSKPVRLFSRKASFADLSISSFPPTTPPPTPRRRTPQKLDAAWEELAIQLKGNYIQYIEAMWQVKKSHPRNMYLQVFNPKHFIANPEIQGDKARKNDLFKRFIKCCKSGFLNSNSLIGCYVTKSDDYEKLNFFFDIVLKKLANVPLYTPIKVNNMLTNHNEPMQHDYDLSRLKSSKFIHRCEMMFTRNLATFDMIASMTPSERRRLETYVTELVEHLPTKYKGSLYSYDKESKNYLPPEPLALLKTNREYNLFPDIAEDQYLESAGVLQNYPTGSGVFISENMEYLIQFGFEDHLVIKVHSENPHMAQVYEQLIGFYEAINNAADDLKVINSAKERNSEYNYVRSGQVSAKTLLKKKDSKFEESDIKTLTRDFYLKEAQKSIPRIRRKSSKPVVNKASFSNLSRKHWLRGRSFEGTLAGSPGTGSAPLSRLSSFLVSARFRTRRRKEKEPSITRQLSAPSLPDETNTIPRTQPAGLNFEVHDKYGFITSCPSNLGTGFRVNVYVTLSNLAEEGLIKQVVNNAGLVHQGLEGEYSLIGPNGTVILFPLSNINRNEEETIAQVYSALPKIFEAEEEASYV